MFEMGNKPEERSALAWHGLAAFRTCNCDTDCHADTVPILEELPVPVKLAFTWRGGQLAPLQQQQAFGPHAAVVVLLLARRQGWLGWFPAWCTLRSVRQSCKPDAVKDAVKGGLVLTVPSRPSGPRSFASCSAAPFPLWNEAILLSRLCLQP